jgi:hypothetical protein
MVKIDTLNATRNSFNVVSICDITGRDVQSMRAVRGLSSCVTLHKAGITARNMVAQLRYIVWSVIALAVDCAEKATVSEEGRLDQGRG